jgi:hypothetical protein
LIPINTPPLAHFPVEIKVARPQINKYDALINGGATVCVN